MNLLLSLFVLLLTLSVFVLRGTDKILPFFIYAICLCSISITVYPSTLINVPVLFFLSMLFCWKDFLYEITKTKVVWLVFLMLLATLILWWHSPHYAGISGLLRLIKIELIEKYLILFYAFYVFTNNDGWEKVLQVSFYCLLVLTFFGLVNLITQHAIFVDWALEGAELNEVTMDAGEKFTEAARFRVQAMHLNAFVYGYICNMLLFLFVYAREKGLLESVTFAVAVGCCIFGILACGCRTLIITTFMGYAVYCLMMNDFRTTMKYGAIGLGLIVALILLVPSLAEKAGFFLTIFDEDASTGSSSSIGMRLLQIGAVLYYIQDNMLFGLGKDYFYIDMDYASGKALDSDLYGMEGVYLNLLLERGLIGLLFYIIFWGGMIFFFIRKKAVDRPAVAFALSVITSYLIFSIMTGELNSAFLTLLLCGMVMAEFFKTQSEEALTE